MYSIFKKNVETYLGSDRDLIYLQTTVEDLLAHNVQLVFTDRNAALQICRFSCDIAELDTMIDWPLMRERMWKNTESDHDRRERRMAECLAHNEVPWSAFTEVVVHNRRLASRIALPGTIGNRPAVSVRPDWYF